MHKEWNTEHSTQYTVVPEKMAKLFEFKRQTAAKAGNCRRCLRRVAAVEKSGGKWSQITGKVDDSQEKYIKLSGKLCNAHHSSLYIHAHTHTHNNIYMYLYMYISIYMYIVYTA